MKIALRTVVEHFFCDNLKMSLHIFNHFPVSSYLGKFHSHEMAYST